MSMPLTPLWENWIKFLAPGFNQAQHWLLQPAEEMNKQIEDLYMYN